MTKLIEAENKERQRFSGVELGERTAKKIGKKIGCEK